MFTFIVFKFIVSKNNQSEKEHGLNILLLYPSLKLTYLLQNAPSSKESCQNSGTSKGFVSKKKIG